MAFAGRGLMHNGSCEFRWASATTRELKLANKISQNRPAVELISTSILLSDDLTMQPLGRSLLLIHLFSFFPIFNSVTKSYTTQQLITF
jgi:hypothetical protein